MDILAALLPPAFMAGVVIAFVVWLYRSQLANKDEDGEQHDDEDEDGSNGRS